MKIEIKLNDPIFCDGCPCFQASYYGGSPDCGMDYEIIDNCKNTRRASEWYKRPQICIDRQAWL